MNTVTKELGKMGNNKTYKKTKRYNQLLTTFVKEIEKRGGETLIEEKHGQKDLKVVEWNKRRQQMLLTVKGFRHYSNRSPAWKVAIAYICGIDDSGPWAVRVPGTTENIYQALDFIEPAEVKKARKNDKRVLRQGDVYAVETGNGKDRANEYDLPWSHTWAHTSRILMHDGHKPLSILYPCRFTQQKALGMGRNGRYGSAD